MSTTPDSLREYARGHVRRAKAREDAREEKRRVKRLAANAAARELVARFGGGLAIYVFGSVLNSDTFRLDSDIDIAVRGVPTAHYYEAWRIAESALADGRLDLIRLEDAPGWLVEVIETRGERIA